MAPTKWRPGLSVDACARGHIIRALRTLGSMDQRRRTGSWATWHPGVDMADGGRRLGIGALRNTALLCWDGNPLLAPAGGDSRPRRGAAWNWDPLSCWRGNSLAGLVNRGLEQGIGWRRERKKNASAGGGGHLDVNGSPAAAADLD